MLPPPDGRHWISCPHGLRLQRSVHHPVRDTLAWLLTAVLGPLSGQQMRRVTLAGDGHLYDLRAIQAHIRANLGRQMVSPITKRPMTMEVHHAY